MIRLRHIILFIACLIYNSTYAQRNEVYSDNIASLQISGVNELLPIYYMDSSTPLTIAFDELSHDYHHYAYKIEHCEYDWAVSKDLFENDFIDGFAEDNIIYDAQQSINTNILYTHYSFELPNKDCRFKIGGNYKITVYDLNNKEQPEFTVYILVSEQTMGVNLNVITNTDIDINHSHQQVEMKVNYGSISVINPSQQIKATILQNGRWDNICANPAPTYTTSSGLQWSHNKDLIFSGGNEYRKFEILDDNHPTLRVESIKWDGNLFNAYITTDEPRTSYVYDESANGAFFIRNSDNIDNDTQSDYLKVHFRLKSPRLSHPIYINGIWTNGLFNQKTMLSYNEDEQMYETTILLKQGYYSYQYLQYHPNNGAIFVPSEGNFFQTRNKYQALIYYRGYGERTDRLVGVGLSNYH